MTNPPSTNSPTVQTPRNPSKSRALDLAYAAMVDSLNYQRRTGETDELFQAELEMAIDVILEERNAAIAAEIRGGQVVAVPSVLDRAVA